MGEGFGIALCANTASRRYHSIRIDAVHYCEREEVLAEKRKRRSFFDRNAEPEDTAQARMRLLCRTLRDDADGLGTHVLFLKTPYMTRETCKGDLARILAVCPNLRYADLPEGFFAGDPSCTTLRQGVEARCPDMRKMTYNHGAEPSLEALAAGLVWRSLEVLELARLTLDPTTLRYVFGGLARLRALKIKDMPALTDALFEPSQHLPPVPPLRELLLENTPQITARGLQSYLSAPPVAHTLHTLSLTSTGTHPADLHTLLAGAPALRHLSVVEAVSAPFPTHVATPPLASAGLRTLHYEITAAPESAQQYAAGTGAYYAYLTASLLADGLPALERLYVRDAAFPESLIEFAPPRPRFVAESSPPPKPSPFAAYGGGSRPTSTASSIYNSPPPPTNPYLYPHAPAPRRPAGRGGLRRELEVYTKGLEEMEWQFARVAAAGATGRRGSMTALRPVSAYGLEAAGGRMSGSWGRGDVGGVRRSVVVGNGFGGFLAVPADDGRPRSSGGGWPGVGLGGGGAGKREERYDIWR